MRAADWHCSLRAMTMHKNDSAKVKSPDDARWAAVVARDPSFDGAFYYCVATTGVYCRPSCSARLPKRTNVSFQATTAAAEAAGFRQCRRCRPKELPAGARYAAMIASACRRIESAEEVPTLAELSAAVDLSPHHFHRIFKSITGVTPKAYAVAHRISKVRNELGKSATVTDAIHASGYNSNGRFYANSAQVLGMSPSDFRAGGNNTEIRFAVGECSLGSILVAASEKGVCAILMGDDPAELLRDLQDRFPKAQLLGGDRKFEKLAAKAIAAVERPGTKFDLPLDVRGTAFQHRVWQALRDIPSGSTATYSDIARRIRMPKSVRAVAGACAANPIAVVIPCHRVVRIDGNLSGYRWGIERKRKLLEREKCAGVRPMGLTLLKR